MGLSGVSEQANGRVRGPVLTSRLSIHGFSEPQCILLTSGSPGPQITPAHSTPKFPSSFPGNARLLFDPLFRQFPLFSPFLAMTALLCSNSDQFVLGLLNQTVIHGNWNCACVQKKIIGEGQLGGSALEAGHKRAFLHVKL